VGDLADEQEHQPTVTHQLVFRLMFGINPNALSYLFFNDNNYLHRSFGNTFDDSLLPHKMQLLVQFL
jgi:hypothetical protein